MIRLMIVDDHPLVRAGLVALVSDDVDVLVVGEAGDGETALDLAIHLQPDVVLMDLSMPGMGGVEATRRLTLSVETAVVVLTSFLDDDQVNAALAAGAVGYLLKDSDSADLLRGVHQAAEGYAPIDARVARALLPGVERDQSQPANNVLSSREQEVLRLVARGLANKQIARSLGISESTVKAHVGSIFRAIGVSDRTSAAMWARTYGLASP